jgi:hypothetical protein
MPTSAEINAKVKDLMAKGDIEGARLALAETASDLPPEPAKPAEPPKPRDPAMIVVDILTAFNNILGNHPAVAPLMAELKDVVTQPETKLKAS